RTGRTDAVQHEAQARLDDRGGDRGFRRLVLRLCLSPDQARPDRHLVRHEVRFPLGRPLPWSSTTDCIKLNKRAGPKPCSNENEPHPTEFVLSCSTEIFGDFKRLSGGPPTTW